MAHQVINNVFTPDIEKVIIKGDSNDIQVPFNKINLSDSSSLLKHSISTLTVS